MWLLSTACVWCPAAVKIMLSITPKKCILWCACIGDCWLQFLLLPFMRVVKGIFVTRDRSFFFPVKCEMANFFLVNRDFHSSREAWFCKIIFRETRNKCLIRREPWFSLCLCYCLCSFRDVKVDPCCDNVDNVVGFSVTLASNHFHSPFRLFRPEWRKRIKSIISMSKMTKMWLC